MPVLRLALRNLLQDRLRFGLTVVGVAVSIMLMLFLVGLRTGVLRSSVVYLDNTPGSVVVLPPGAKSTGAGAAHFLTAGPIESVVSAPGVAAVTPVLTTIGATELDGRKEILKLVGYDPERGGGPWSLAAGGGPADENEVVIDRVLANRHGLRLGDILAVGGRSPKIVGLSNETSSWTGSYVFARTGFVESLVLAQGAASFLLVTPAPGTSARELVATLGTDPGRNVLLKTDVMANDQQITAGIVDRVLLLMVVAAFIVGALVVGMVVYTATTERRTEYGILKAIGASSGVLYQVVAAQAVIAALLGAALGVGFVFAVDWLVVAARHQFLVIIQPAAIATGLVAGLVMAIAGALLPARGAARLAPADVFRR
jgi:putative ABC transport system permease protein